MARHSRRHRSRSRSRSLAGGSYSSAATYGEYVNGSGNSQYNRVFDQAGSYGQIQGNVIIGAQGQNVAPASQAPNASQLALVQKAGRRRRRGGFLGEVVNQAVVPLSLLGMQQSYRRSKRGGKTKKNKGGFVGEVVNQAVVPLAILGMQQNYGRKRNGGKTRRHRKH
jgi:hypothetical protein